MEDKKIILEYTPFTTEDEKTRYYIHGINCIDINTLHRLGEFVSVMNGCDEFYIHDCSTNTMQQITMNEK